MSPTSHPAAPPAIGDVPAAGVTGRTPDQPAPSHETSSARAQTPRTSGKKKSHRGGKKKKRARKPSFALPSEEDGSGLPGQEEEERDLKNSTARNSFYGVRGRSLSNTSGDSEALLDHRAQKSLRPRKPSALQQQSSFSPGSFRPQYSDPFSNQETQSSRLKHKSSMNTMGVDDDPDERTPMLSASRPKSSRYDALKSHSDTRLDRQGRKVSGSSATSKKRAIEYKPYDPALPTYNINNPPSIPASPILSPSQRQLSLGDPLADDFRTQTSVDGRDRSELNADADANSHDGSSSHGSPERRPTMGAGAEADVCFPAENVSEAADDENTPMDETGFRRSSRRRRAKQWPDLAVLDECSRIEKEGKNEERRAKRMVEPQLIGGRLRTTHSRNWFRAEEDAPYRFTYFNEDFPSTIHSQTISELVRPGGSFRELFVPEPLQLSDSSSEDEVEKTPLDISFTRHSHSSPERIVRHSHSSPGTNGDSKRADPDAPLMDKLSPWLSAPEGKASLSKPGDHNYSLSTPANGGRSNSKATSAARSSGSRSPGGKNKPKRYGDRPTWWLDVLSPTDSEMKILSKAFGIHPLTAEDILMQEAREKVELFRNYYLVNYRTFEQDMNNENFLEPVNMYVVVFREGVISFHFSLTPHPANVRRRIRQLKDYLLLTSDWISYAIIDDITDAFAPLIQNIEDEADDIDDAILKLHSSTDEEKSYDEKHSDAGGNSAASDSNMLRRVGDCRKKVMGLYRLLGNKADVIKGFAKRCNENWDVAPRSEIGLYLGDIQDHIVTMTGNLTHYEKILARSHGNYLAQINIRMNERQEKTADVLGRLTVLGTIVLPMNIITGLWGMNVWVPGQDYEHDLTWFFCITVALFAFGLACFFMARTLYRIV